MIWVRHCSLTLSEEQRVNVLNNRELEKMFGPKRVEVAGGWIKLYNEEQHDFPSTPNPIGVTIKIRMAWAGYGALENDKIGA